jgi:hypothetical protein
VCFVYFLLFIPATQEIIQHARKLHGENVLGRWAGTDGLKRFEILQGHRLLVNRLGSIEDRLQRLSEAFRPQQLGLAFTLCVENGSLFLTHAQSVEFKSKSEEEHKVYLESHAADKLEVLWYFVVSLCRLLQTKDYQLTPEEAYWLGVVDEVTGSGLQSDREMIEMILSKDQQRASHEGLEQENHGGI